MNNIQKAVSAIPMELKCENTKQLLLLTGRCLQQTGLSQYCIHLMVSSSPTMIKSIFSLDFVSLPIES